MNGKTRKSVTGLSFVAGLVMIVTLFAAPAAIQGKTPKLTHAAAVKAMKRNAVNLCKRDILNGGTTQVNGPRPILIDSSCVPARLRPPFNRPKIGTDVNGYCKQRLSRTKFLCSGWNYVTGADESAKGKCRYTAAVIRGKRGIRVRVRGKAYKSPTIGGNLVINARLTPPLTQGGCWYFLTKAGGR